MQNKQKKSPIPFLFVGLPLAFSNVFSALLGGGALVWWLFASQSGSSAADTVGTLGSGLLGIAALVLGGVYMRHSRNPASPLYGNSRGALWAIVGICLGIATIAFAAGLVHQAPVPSASQLDGTYVWDSKSPYETSTVQISSSTPETISYEISTINLLHLGNLAGTAYRIKGTDAYAYTDSNSNDGCRVTIGFSGDGVSYYTSSAASTSTASCDDYHGAHGSFFNSVKHKRNVTVTLPTITELGFTDQDLAQFEGLLKGVVSGAQGFIGLDLEEGSTTHRLTSKDIPDALAFSIETPNLYNGSSACDFSQQVGYCEYAAFMKDGAGHYWVIGGSDGDTFTYATNDPAWQKKLPDVFAKELKRLGLTADSVVFTSAVSESALVGGWTMPIVGGASADDSQEIDFAIENGAHTYNSYIHSRPDNTDCTWALAGSTVSIDCPSENIKDSFQIKSLTKDSLTITHDGSNETYSRVPASAN